MIPYIGNSRILKAFTDQSGGPGFEQAEKLLGTTFVVVAVSTEQSKTVAGQAAALTAVITAVKCFKHVALIADHGIRLVRPLPVGNTLGAAASALGAKLVTEIPKNTTHVISIDYKPDNTEAFIHCWWDGWITGVIPPWEWVGMGTSENPLAGVFAGALAVREVFASILGKRAGNSMLLVSLWEPWAKNIVVAEVGPSTIYVPSKLWFIGLGHLGQGYLWNLAFLSVVGGHAVIQDDQAVGDENVATGLLTTNNDIEKSKVRVASGWLEGLGWTTSHMERRHYGDIKVMDDDPAIVITGLDNIDARKKIARAGFDYMIDAGVGHGPTDFDSLQLTVLKKGIDADQFWTTAEKTKDVDSLMQEKAYQKLTSKHGTCGTFSLAEASVAVPFVGAAVGALAIAQAIRLGNMQKTIQVMQMSLGSPGMVIPGDFNNAPAKNLGGVQVKLYK